MAATKEEILDAIGNMSVLEIVDLVKMMEDKFGVTAAAPMMMAAGGGGAAAAIEEINGIKLDARILDGIGAKDLRPMVNEAIQKLGNGVVAYVAAADGKAAIAVASTVASVSAVDLVKAAVLAMGGQGGGGKPDFAQGGAPTADAASAGLDAVKAAMAS